MIPPTIHERAEALLAGGDRDDASLPDVERELRQIRQALRRGGFSEAQLAGRLGWGNLTTGVRLTGQQPTDRRERLAMATALMAMVEDREAAQADAEEGGPP